MPEEPNNLSPSPELPSVEPAPVVTAAPVSGTPVIPTPPAKTSFKNKKLLGIPLLIAAAAVILVSGSAAAYFGYVVPNKPENVLKKALPNTAQQSEISFDGKLTYESTEEKSELKAVNVSFKGQANTQKNAFDSTFEVTASGIKLPFETRFLDKNVYFKVGDLGTIKNLAQTAAPGAGAIVDTLNKKLSNQWIEVDETLLKQAGGSCVLDKSFALTQDDIKLLQNRYQQVPFITVKSTANDKVNNHSAIKYELEINDNKGAEYVKGLQDLSIIKKIKECDKNAKTDDTNGLADGDITPITIWVDKGSKRIVKFAAHSTKQDEEKEHFKANVEITFSYGPVNISKPSGAKPLMDIIGDFSQLLGGIPLGSTGLSGQNVPTSGMSKECEAAFQAYINSGGTADPPTNCL